MSPTSSDPSPRTLALVGAVLLLPALLFVSASVLKFQLGAPFLYDTFEGVIRTIDSPVVIVGGLVAAALLNLWPTLRLSLKREPEAVVGTVTVRPYWSNLAVVGTSVLFLGIILAYLVVENLHHLRES